MSRDALTNKGVAFLNAENVTSKKNIVVLGVARGGTSLAAGALSKLGVFMGDLSVEPVFEDVKLSNAFERSGNIKAIVSDYDSRYDVWGWKRPKAVEYLDEVTHHLSNQHYIVIFKDVFSVANRNSISMQADIITSLEHAQHQYDDLLKFIKSTKSPVMLVSAEKALSNKESFVDSLVEHFNLEVTEIDIKNAIDFITPNPAKYLENTRITKVVGCVDSISRSRVHGWVYGVHHNAPVIVEVYCNNELLISSAADKLRTDLLRLAIHSTGNCGFNISLEGLKLPKIDCEIKVIAKNDIQALKNGIAII